ncbi:bifunctional metallophosphatase/5'-nucleotidase [Parapedobacter indicus]|uniref:5'-nucleotidase n=1 Tax=Parapedobacter indicus TaxID=1477437 RepID=A0A1I3SLZ1_9SPHI|nr:metallophosphatase [Parapedobacter indicus]PPK99758.1 5'-nucleotidase [Parapedobacter indicus]SFJ59828.1 5'-nucleotidase [Parapedobacter indicus]
MDELSTINRRRFLKQAGTLAALSTVGGIPLTALANEDHVTLTILHTNDVHSRIDPFPMDGSRNQGLGGVARRATLVERIRSEQRNVLLLDAGDTVQGTPYFNLFGGKVELELMSRMRYDASTFGNHEFDNGLEGLAKMLPYAKFPFLTANYDFSDTLLKGKTRDYIIFRKQGLRIGVFGLGIQLAGLVDPTRCQGVRYLDPVTTANVLAERLKQDYRCNLVVCLSHLGYKYQGNKVSDVVLARNTRNIDLIIGGHTHTFMPEPEHIRNLDGQMTTINQVGFAGINLGRLDYIFERQSKKKKLVTAGRYKMSERMSAVMERG